MSSIVKLKNVTKKINKKIIIDDLNFEIKKGTSLMFLGPNGAGKTTTIRLIMSILKLTSGEIKLFDEVINEKNISSIHQRIGVQSDSQMYENLTVKDNLNFFGNLYGMSNEQIDQKSEELLTFFNLKEKENEKIINLSKGMRQKVSLVRAMLNSPELLILDEPTAGLDPDSTQELIDLLVKMRNKYSLTLIMSTHQLSGLEKLGDEIVIIREGKNIAHVTRDAIEKISMYILDTNNNDKAKILLDEMQLDNSIANSKIQINDIDEGIISEIIQKIVNAKIGVKAVIPKTKTIKEFYFEQVGRQYE